MPDNVKRFESVYTVVRHKIIAAKMREKKNYLLHKYATYSLASGKQLLN